MPSALRRIALTLPTHVDQAVSELADAQGKPIATVIVELLEGTTPQLLDLARLQRAVNAGQLQLAGQLSRQMLGDAAIPAAHAQHELEGMLANVPPDPVPKRPKRSLAVSSARKAPAKGRRGA